MAVSEEDIDFARDLFSGLGGEITTRKMMGGLCLYCDGTIFSILNPDGSIWIKGQGDFIARLEGMGLERWTYTRDTGKTTAMPYWRLPDAALDDPDEATTLAREALQYL